MVDKLLEIDRYRILQKFSKTEDDVYWDTKHICDWLTKQPHLPNPSSERRLEYILLQNKWSLEKAKRSLEMYYTVKNHLPEIFDNWDTSSPQLQSTFKVCAWLPLRKLTKDCSRVGILRLLINDPDMFNPWEVAKMMILIGEIRSQYDYNFGEHLIFDMQGFKLAHLKHILPTYVKKVYVLTRQIYRLKLQGIYLLNAPTNLLKIILPLLKPIIKPKLYKRIHVPTNLEALHEFIPKEILPVEYGGNEPVYQESFHNWITELENLRHWLLIENKLRADDSKRIDLNDLLNNSNDIFGSIDGSFRKLQID